MTITRVNLVNTVEGTLPVANGGTGATTQAAAANAVLPSQTGNTGRYLTTNGTDTSWGVVTSNPGTVTSVNLTAGTAISVSGGPITSSGSITVNNTGVTSIVAGTGISISGGTGAVTITNSSPGGVTSLNGQTGAITNTDLYAIGSYVIGRPANNTDVAPNTTIAAASLFNLGTGIIRNTQDNIWAFQGTGATATASVVTTGTWRAMSRAPGSASLNSGWAGLWVRIS
jgi:hypothetical protein